MELVEERSEGKVEGMIVPGKVAVKPKRKLDVDPSLEPDWKRSRKGEIFFWPGHNKYGFMANDYSSAFTVGGMTFASVEWYVWYERAKVWSPGTDLAVLIREAKTTELAKQLSRRCRQPREGIEDEWTTVRLNVMAKAVLKKFECSSYLSSELLSTGDCKLHYAAKYDAFWPLPIKTLRRYPPSVPIIILYLIPAHSPTIILLLLLLLLAFHYPSSSKLIIILSSVPLAPLAFSIYSRIPQT
jgi:ribA/ribD-fused uncharacterized protein